MNVTQVQAGQAAVLTLTAYTDGTATDQGTFTIGIVDGNGDTVVSSGTAVTDNADGTYEYSLAAQADPAFLTVTWTEAGGTLTYSTFVEVVGSVLFTEAALRSFDDGELATSKLNPSDTTILECRQRVTEWMEQQTGRAMVPRYCRTVLEGTGSYQAHLDDGWNVTSAGLPLHRPGSGRDVQKVLGVEIAGTSITTSNFTPYPDGMVVRTDATWTRPTSTNPRNVVVEYVYGMAHPFDGADRIAMMVAAHQLKSSRIPDNAMGFSDGVSEFQFDTTRIPFEAWQWVKAQRAYAPFA